MLVGLCVERSLEMIVGILAILKAGGAYVPLDPSYPKERLAFMLEDSRAVVLISQSSLIESLPKVDATLLCVDEVWEQAANESDQNPGAAATPENLAYVIYTSGSTGTPKGVAMHHRPLCNLVTWQLGASQLPYDTRTLQFAPLSFDVSFQETFSTWCSGGTLVLISQDLRRDTARLWDFISDKSLGRVFLPVAALKQLTGLIALELKAPVRLRQIITAGEQLQINRDVTNWFLELKDCEFHNQYGPSETHVVTAFTLRDSPDNWPALPPIGRPVANTQIYLLDCQMNPVPMGAAGELFIGGAGVARGYLNRPNLTAEKFIPNPFGNDSGSRLYRTGDLARYSSRRQHRVSRTDRPPSQNSRLPHRAG